ncbi:hypothetical protein [Burkholderia cepacia]|uniref:hypothetical protein n=1 Tax=Burkholderia cepacia TaxID=292 RepID=UPI003EE0397E
MRNPHARFFHAFLFGTLATSLLAIGAIITTAATAPRAHAAGVETVQVITLRSYDRQGADVWVTAHGWAHGPGLVLAHLAGGPPCSLRSRKAQDVALARGSTIWLR